MSTLHWLFGPRQPRPAPVDGAMVLDRIEARLREPVRGDARLVLASQLDAAVSRIGEAASHSTAAMAAQREAARITSMLPRRLGQMLGPILADELVRSRPLENDALKGNRVA